MSAHRHTPAVPRARRQSVKRGKPRPRPSDTASPSTPAASASSPLLRYGLLILACGLAFILYANTLNHDYAVDDQTAIIQNRLTQQGVSALPKIFTSAYR